MAAKKSYGLAEPEREREMSGLQFARALVRGALPLNTLAKTLGYDIVEAEKGRVLITYMPSADHMNPHGTIHGGVPAALLDTCMGLAIRTLLPKGVIPITLEFKMSFLRPIAPDSGLLHAQGKALMVGRRTGVAEGSLTGADGKLLVHATTTCLNQPLG